MYTILVCDDEKDIRKAIRIYLESVGYRVVEAANGLEALESLKKERVQLMLLDWMMPRMDGIQTLERIREFSNIPVIALTAKSEENDKIQGLSAGADDYVTKPFHFPELEARIRAQIRRYLVLSSRSGDAAGSLRIGDVCLDPIKYEVTLAGERVPLTPKEYDLLYFFMTHRGRTWTGREVYENVWKEKSLGNEGTVAVHIRHLREKLEIDPANPRYIQVVWGRGYRMEDRL